MGRPIIASTEDSVREGTDFERFITESSNRLFRALYMITGSPHEAEEVMQDAFLALWERWDRVSRLEDPTGYLYRTAMNTWRKRVRRASLAVRRTIRVAPWDDPFSAVEDRDIVLRALKDLHPNQRAALVVTALLGYRSEEAGAILHMSAAAVRMHASRGRIAMHESIGDVHDR